MKIYSHLVEEPPASVTRPLIEFQKGQLFVNGQPRPLIDPDHIDPVRKGFYRLAEITAGATQVVTFAMGGFIPLAYIADHEQLTETEGHIFPGLSWESGDGPQKFRTWLAHLDPSETVVIFDTGRKGNAIGSIINQVKKAAPSCCIRIICILAEQEPEIGEGAQAYLSKTGIEMEPIVVDRNFFEDRLDLMGYEAMRGKGYIKPVEGMGAFLIGSSVVLGDPLTGILKVLKDSPAMRAALKITGTAG